MLRAQSEGELARIRIGGCTAGESVLFDAFDFDGEGDSGTVAPGDLRIHSNHAPANPLDTHAAKMAASPIRGSCCALRTAFGGDDGDVDSSCTIATPAVRRKRANHFRLERERLKNAREKRAVVRSLSCGRGSESWSQDACQR